MKRIEIIVAIIFPLSLSASLLLLVVLLGAGVDDSVIINAGATIITGILALIAAVMTIKKMDETHRAQMRKLEERDSIEDYYRYIEEIENKINSIKTGDAKRNEVQIETSKIGIDTFHTENNRKGPPDLNENSLREKIKSLEDWETCLIRVNEELQNNDIDTFKIIELLSTISDIYSHHWALVAKIMHGRYASFLTKEGKEYRILELSTYDLSILIDNCKQATFNIIYTAKRYGTITEEKMNSLIQLINLNPLNLYGKSLNFEELLSLLNNHN